MAPAGEIGAEEGVDAGLGHVLADQARAEREDIGVIMLAGERGAESGSETRAQRQAGLRLTAIEMPMPEPQTAMPRSASPVATASASLAPKCG